MAITQKELARKLGIAQVTVSRALRQAKGVQEPLRRRILAAAKRWGYSIETSNREARLMRLRAAGAEVRNNVICVMVNDEGDAASFGGRIMRGMNAEAARIGSEIVTVTHSAGQLPLIVSRRQVDGTIRLMGDIEVAKGIHRPPVPWISLLYDIPDVDVVAVDNFGGALAVGRWLCALGHRRFAYIGPDTELARERLAGLRAAVAESGGDVPDALVRMRSFAVDVQPTRELLDELIPRNGPVPFTALVAYNDYMADTALHYAREQCGLNVPGDLSIAGFDGVLPSRLHAQSVITTAAIPLEELGAMAVRLLEWRLQSPDATRRKVVLETTLVEGATSGPAC